MTNDVFGESGKHYVTLFVLCRRVDETQEPEVRVFLLCVGVVEEWELADLDEQTLEPEKCEGWFWKSWGDVRAMDEGRRAGAQQQLFLPIVNLLREHADVEALCRD